MNPADSQLPPVLIVRTVSLEKLSAVLDACRTRWPDRPLWVVTSPGRAGELKRDPRVAGLVPYTMGPGGFDAPIAFPGEAEAIVVPTANWRGAGYANVLRAARTVAVRQRFLASYARELVGVSRAGWAWRWRSELALGAIARWLGRRWSAALLREFAD